MRPWWAKYRLPVMYLLPIVAAAVVAEVPLQLAVVAAVAPVMLQLVAVKRRPAELAAGR